MHETTQNLSNFLTRQDFNLGVICAVISNYRMVIVINSISLLEGQLEEVLITWIVTIGGDNYYSAYKGAIKLS